MTTITAFNKARNTTYVYESDSHWDKDKQQSRSKRKLIGKIAPKTGNVIPTGPRGRKKSRRTKEATTPVKKPNYKQLYEQATSDIETKDAKIVEQRREIARRELQLIRSQQIVEQIRTLVNICVNR